MPTAELPRPAAIHPPLANRSGDSERAEFIIVPIDVSSDRQNEFATWLVLDRRGRVVARAHSELLAVAKLQILQLCSLTGAHRNVPARLSQ